MKSDFIQRVMELFAFYRNGQTPNGRGLRGETGCYRQAMLCMESSVAAAEDWDFQQSQKGKK